MGFLGRCIAVAALLFTFLCPVPGWSAETILIGINVPLTGAYSVQGRDELMAYRLAIDNINNNGGILGKKLLYSVKDTRTDAAQARINAKELIHEGAVMITGGSSSAVAIAQSEECQKDRVIFMAALTHSNEVTGIDAHRHTFRWYNNAYQSSGALAHALIRQYGPNTRYSFIYADYVWGHSVLKSLKAVIEKNGGKTVLEIPTPLGAQSFIVPLFKVKEAKQDVLVLIHFGRDMVNCLQQATTLGLRKKMAIVVPLMDIHMAKQLGAKIMHGVMTSMPWYHGLSVKYEGSRRFVESFFNKYKAMPGNAAAVAWVDMYQYTDAVERAKSFDHIKVIKALEGHHFTLLLDDEYWRSWDHQGIHPTYVLIGKNPAEQKNKWDLFKIIEAYKGEDLARTRKINPVVLEDFR